MASKLSISVSSMLGDMMLKTASLNEVVLILKFIMLGKSNSVGWGEVDCCCCCLELSTLAPVGLGGALSTEAAEPPRP
jgi:hypothetical protein